MTDVDHACRRIREIGGRRLAPSNGDGVTRQQQAAREKFVGMRTAGMRENRVERLERHRKA
jgi:hypothetical protein